MRQCSWLFLVLLLGPCSISDAAVAEPAGRNAPVWAIVAPSSEIQSLPVVRDPRRFQTFTAARAPGEHPREPYHFAAEIFSSIEALCANRPGVVQPFVVGTTVRNRPIWGFVLRDPARPIHVRMLVFASIHPMEWVPSEIALAFLQTFAASPIPGVELTVVPILDIDGRAAVERDILSGVDQFRRGNANGVDLNRDFGVNREPTAVWKHLIPRRYATSPAPLSQPETRAMDALARTGRYDLAVSLHSFGGFIYTPWAGRWKKPEDWPRLERLGQAMADGQTGSVYRVRQLSRWGFFFRAQGTEIDHLYGRYGTAAFLVETTRSGLEILHPSTFRSAFARYNPKNPAPHVRSGVGMLRAGAWAIASLPASSVRAER
jgi:hypothetical protein